MAAECVRMYKLECVFFIHFGAEKSLTHATMLIIVKKRLEIHLLRIDLHMFACLYVRMSSAITFQIFMRF